MKKKIVLVVLILIASLLLAYAVRLLILEIRHERLLKEYPVAYVEEIRASAEEFSLDPYLVLSIMRWESSFDPDAVSSRGAVGLMQIMPDTGTWIAHKLDLDDTYDESQLYDPALNIRFACWYLSFLSGRFDGVTKHMVAAYNAGHKTVEGWLEDPAYSADGYLTTIPYESTAVYYDRVALAMEQYPALYPALFSSADGAAGTVAAAPDSVLYSCQFA